MHLSSVPFGTLMPPIFRQNIFSVPRNGYNLKFSVCLSDECLMAPLSLFNVDLLELTREETSRKRVNYMSRNDHYV